MSPNDSVEKFFKSNRQLTLEKGIHFVGNLEEKFIKDKFAPT